MIARARPAHSALVKPNTAAGLRFSAALTLGLNACTPVALDLGEQPSGSELITEDNFTERDVRPPVRARTPPPPIGGGAVLFSRDGHQVVAADPARDTLWVIDLRTKQVTRTLTLAQGSEPFRLAADPAGRVHAILRGSGEIVSFSLDDEQPPTRRRVCESPRGLAWSDREQAFLVTCRDGQLVKASETSGDVQVMRRLQADLRDIVIQRDARVSTERVHVSRFKSAQVLELSPIAGMSERSSLTPPEVLAQPLPPLPTVEDAGSPEAPALVAQHHSPSVAWRALASQQGTLLLHQLGQTAEVQLETSEAAYGGTTCGGLVSAALTELRPDGTVRTLGPLVDLTLPVDASLSPSGLFVAVAEAGQPDLESGNSTHRQSAAIRIYPTDRLVTVPPGQPAPEQCTSASHVVLPQLVSEGDRSQAIAVSFDPNSDSRLVALLREPARLLIAHDWQRDLAPDERPETTEILLSETSVADTGNDLFHQATPSGVACASCHPEGQEDGRTWTFQGLGARRTQPLDLRLSQSAPFHWDGEFADLTALMTEVFEQRMGGVAQSEARVGALTSWLDTLTPPSGIRQEQESLVALGRELYFSAEVACASCHNAEPKAYFVGTSTVPLHAPSLTGIAYRAPFMHNGCAPTLKDRFNSDCGGGDAHGKTSHLSAKQIDALVAYLESL